MEYTLLFQAFMVFYLLEIVFIAVFVYMIGREYDLEEQQQATELAKNTGPSPSDLIMMRQKMRELQRQQE
jgi:hypothetical protein